MKISISQRSARSAFTMVEMLVVVAILGILTAILVPSLAKGKELAEAMKNTANIRQIAVATLTFAADNGNKLPSPQYPGGSLDDPEDFPPFWDLADSGLWLDGVIFAHMYISAQAEREEEAGETGDEYASTGGYTVDEEGSHLKGTLFENTRAVKTDVDEKDWHKHSYAMNKNLQYDRIYESASSEDPYLTEKTLANLPFMPNALLFIENNDSNVIDFQSREEIIQTMEQRWDGNKAIAAFLDGHAERIREIQIPIEDPYTDRESSRFWRGVDPD